jgi:hypothetical protein
MLNRTVSVTDELMQRLVIVSRPQNPFRRFITAQSETITHFFAGMDDSAVQRHIPLVETFIRFRVLGVRTLNGCTDARAYGDTPLQDIWNALTPDKQTLLIELMGLTNNQALKQNWQALWQGGINFHTLETAVTNKVRPVFVPPVITTPTPTGPNTVSGDTLELIKQLGEVTLVPLSNGRMSSSILLCEDKLKTFLAIPDINTLFAGPDCPNNKTYQVKTNGTLKIMVDMDLYQQKALLKAIVAKAPQFKTVLGFYNTRASRKVFDVYKALAFVGTAANQIYWIWTGEVFNTVFGNINDPAAEAQYPDEAIITLENSDPRYQMEADLSGKHFVSRNFARGAWLVDDPVSRNDRGAGLLGVLHG